MTKKEIVELLKKKDLYDMAHGFWLDMFYPIYQKDKLSQKKLFVLLGLKKEKSLKNNKNNHKP